MGNSFHIAEVAILLFVAYAAGWLVGYLARRVAAGLRQTVPAIPAERLAAVTAPAAPADALVKAPMVVPVSDAPPPPTPAAAAALAAVTARVTNEGEVLVDAPAAPVQADSVSGIDSLKSLSSTMPLLPSEDAPATGEMVGAAADHAPPAAEESLAPAAVEPMAPEPVRVDEPVAAAEPAEPASIVPQSPEPAPTPAAAPASRPGVAWAGAINGYEATRFEPPVIPASDIEIAAPQLPDVPSETPFAPVALHDDLPAAQPDDPDDEPAPGLDIAVLGNLAEQLKAEAVAPPPPAEGLATEAAGIEPLPVEPQPQPAPVAVAPPLEPQPPAEPAQVEFDEGAAMRAIEGGWSRRDARALPDAPELTDVSAAVSAAQLAVEQVLTLNGLDLNEAETRAQASFGKPRGLGKPRDGGRDDLKQINGLGPLDESTLNNLGVFHLDQIANWDEREVLWLENHAFARGRIGREAWQAQARDLLAGAGDGARAAR